MQHILYGVLSDDGMASMNTMLIAVAMPIWMPFTSNSDADAELSALVAFIVVCGCHSHLSRESLAYRDFAW